MNASYERTPEDEPVPPGFNVWATLLRRWPILLVGVLLGCGIGVALHNSTPPMYQSSAQVLVLKKRNATELVKDGEVRVNSVDDYVATQVTLIKSEKIRLAAAQKARGMAFSQPLPTDNFAVAGQIGGGLGISRDKEATTNNSAGSSVLNLTMTHPHPDDCRTFLEAVILAHQAELYTIYDQATQEKLATLDRLLEAIQDQRQEAGEQKIQLLEQLRGITSEEVAGIRIRLSSLRTRLSSLEADRIDLADQLELIANAGPKTSDRQLTLAQLTAPSRTNAVASVTSSEVPRRNSSVRELESQRRELVATLGLGKDHPRVLALTARLAALEAEQEQPVATDTNTLDELGVYTKWLEQKKRTTDRQYQQADEQLRKDEATLKSVGVLQDRIDKLTNTLQQTEGEINRLEAEKLTTQATQGAGGYALEQITPPAAGRKISPVFTRSLTSGLGVGLAVAVAVIFLLEWTDKGFRTPSEIRQRLGLTIIGNIPRLPRNLTATTTSASGLPSVLTSRLSPTLIAAHRMQSQFAETYRGLRTQVFFGTQGLSHRTIQVTSPTPGDGKSLTAANLAISIAQAGKRTILVDCDLRKPTVHKLFGVESTRGVAGVIAGVDSLSQSIVASGVDNLDVLPCGSRPTNPAELLSSPQFLAVLQAIQEGYEFIIVDTPPLLAVSDPAILAPRMDGVVLVLRLTKQARPTAEAARESLSSVGAKMLGVVLNGADFGTSGFGYAYGSPYAYAEIYQDQDEADQRVGRPK